jgi:predicted GIY-YIG superfamily endonuclease
MNITIDADNAISVTPMKLKYPAQSAYTRRAASIPIVVRIKWNGVLVETSDTNRTLQALLQPGDVTIVTDGTFEAGCGHAAHSDMSWFSACVYMLPLVGGHFYVGISNHVNRRLGQHLHGHGALYTRRYKPLGVVRLFYPGTLSTERTVTRAFMAIYGDRNVRGSAWCRVDPLVTKATETRSPVVVASRIASQVASWAASAAADSYAKSLIFCLGNTALSVQI